MKNNKYVLITSAKNEAKYISDTLESVLSQSIVPIKWIVVSDGSIDGTDKILKDYELKHDILKYIRIDSSKELGFISKVLAIKKAYELLRDHNYEFIGILDADVSFDVNYYENIIGKFNDNPKLGISGGYIYEQDPDATYRSRKTNRERCVAGAVQMFRRECYERIGGLYPIRYGGEDTLAEIMARVYGWEVRSFPEFKVLHHNPSHRKRGIWRERFRLGKLDYVLGYHIFYELMKFIRRIPENPFFLGSVVRISGFFAAMLASEERIPPPDVVRHIRKEQMSLLLDIIRSRSKDNF